MRQEWFKQIHYNNKQFSEKFNILFRDLQQVVESQVICHAAYENSKLVLIYIKYKDCKGFTFKLNSLKVGSFGVCILTCVSPSGGLTLGILGPLETLTLDRQGPVRNKA